MWWLVDSEGLLAQHLEPQAVQATAACSWLPMGSHRTAIGQP